MREYFAINESSVTNPLVVREAHKTVIWGAPIKIGVRLKARSHRAEELFAQLHSLECSHKAGLARSTYQDLLHVRKELCELLFHKTKQKLAWAHRTNSLRNRARY